MSDKLGQENAFPEFYENRDGTINHLPGMSKRFYAACAAMQGLLANSNPDMIYSKKPFFIKDCYEYADELLKQENEE